MYNYIHIHVYLRTEEAGIGVTLSTSSGAEAIVPYERYSPPPVFSPPHVKKEKTSNITPPAYFGLVRKYVIYNIGVD